MREDWELKRLDELFVVKSSKRVHKADWKGEGVPFYRAREVVKLAQNGKVDNDLFISEELYDEFTKEKGAPKEGDIIISAVGTLGQCYLVKEDDRFYFKDASVLWFENTSNVDTKFIEYAFKSDLVMEQVMHKSMGATVGTLTISRAKIIQIPIPPLQEQQQIVAMLDKAFKAIDQAKANIEKNIDNAKELFQSKLNEIFSQKGEGWVEKTLEEVCEIKPPKKISKEKLNRNDLVSFVPMKYLSINQMYFNSEERRTLDNVYSGYVYFEDNDVVLAKITPCFENGKLGIAINLKNGIGFGSSEYVVYRAKMGVLFNEYLYFFLNRESFRVKGKSLMSGAVGHKRIQPSFYENEVILLPPIEYQTKLCNQIKELQLKLESLANKYYSRIKGLDELKKSILQKAFAGELTNKTVVV